MKDRLASLFAQRVVENLDVESLEDMVYDMLYDDYQEYSLNQLKETIKDYNENLYDELMEEVNS